MLFAGLCLSMSCTKEDSPNDKPMSSFLDTLIVSHSEKGWELYSRPASKAWTFTIMLGTNRTKTYQEVVTNPVSAMRLITVTGIDSLKMVLAKFPEDEFITWPGKVWLQKCWIAEYGDLQLPPQNFIDDISLYCSQKKLNLQVIE